MTRRGQQDRLNMTELERLYRVYTDTQGQIDEPSIWKDFREYLVADAERCLPDSVLADYRERYDKVHRLRDADLEQPSLPGFEDRYLHQLRPKKPVWMLRASRDKLITCLDIEPTAAQVWCG